MNKELRLLTYAFFSALMTIFSGCKKDVDIPIIKIPTLITTAVSAITTTSDVTGGSVTSSGGSEVTVRGVCWSTINNPTVAGSKTTDGIGTGSFISVMADLTPNTAYYVRAYATNSAGTAYGNEISFHTLSIVTTSAIVSFSSTSAVVTGNVIYGQIGNHLIGSGICWSTSQNPTTADSKAPNDTYSGIFTSNLTGLIQGTTYFVRAYAVYDNGPTIYGNELSFTTSFESGTGIQKADFPGGARFYATGFSIGTKVYLGLGYTDGNLPKRDFWEWDQTTNLWTKKADYPGNASSGAVGFSIGTKGYIGTGGNFSTNGVTNEFWEYDPATNTWAEKSSLPAASGRAYAVGFSIGTKGYIGTGIWYDGISRSNYQDFWEWDQTTNLWTKKANYPGNASSGAVGFSIGTKGYIGTGGNGTPYSKDFWEWDQATDAWSKKADFGGTARGYAIGFSIGNRGYIGTGNAENLFKDIWEWDQVTNTWLEKSNLKGDARTYAVAVSIGNKAYIGTGVGGNNLHGFQDFWEYDPNLK